MSDTHCEAAFRKASERLDEQIPGHTCIQQRGISTSAFRNGASGVLGMAFGAAPVATFPA